ncbi:hypothetical protein TKK_0003037 [Trichogramma kaykai]
MALTSFRKKLRKLFKLKSKKSKQAETESQEIDQVSLVHSSILEDTNAPRPTEEYFVQSHSHRLSKERKLYIQKLVNEIPIFDGSIPVNIFLNYVQEAVNRLRLGEERNHFFELLLKKSFFGEAKIFVENNYIPSLTLLSIRLRERFIKVIKIQPEPVDCSSSESSSSSLLYDEDHYDSIAERDCIKNGFNDNWLSYLPSQRQHINQC